MKAGFIAKVFDDQFGDFVGLTTFNEHNIDTSHYPSRCTHGEKLGLTFTEMLSSTESSILMYRNVSLTYNYLLMILMKIILRVEKHY